jgi:hypothetical protein
VNAAELEGKRRVALKGILNSPEAARRFTADYAKAEALFLIAEQLATLNEKFTPARLVSAIAEIQAALDKKDDPLNTRGVNEGRAE